MPSPSQALAFEQSCVRRLRAPLDDYFSIVNLYGADSLNARIAISATKLTMERTLAQLHMEAARLGAGGRLTAEQNSLLALIVQNDVQYMRIFMQALPGLSKSAAYIRVGYYVTTIMHTLNEFAAYALPKLPVYPGDRVALICQWHCKCRLDIRKVGNDDWDVFWRRSARESCASCKALERAWNPLEIRDGKIADGQALTTTGQVRAIKGMVALLTTHPDTKHMAAKLLQQWIEVA